MNARATILTPGPQQKQIRNVQTQDKVLSNGLKGITQLTPTSPITASASFTHIGLEMAQENGLIYRRGSNSILPMIAGKLDCPLIWNICQRTPSLLFIKY